MGGFTENEIPQKILGELQGQTRVIKKINRITIWALVPSMIFVFTLVALVISRVRDIKNIKKETAINYSKNINYYLDTAEFDKAIEESKKFVEKTPDHYYAWTLLGWSYFDKGDLTEAKKSIEKSLQLYPDDEDNQKVLKSINSRLSQKNKK